MRRVPILLIPSHDYRRACHALNRHMLQQMAPLEDPLTPLGERKLHELTNEYRQILMEEASRENPDEITAKNLKDANERLMRRVQRDQSKSPAHGVSDILIPAGAGVSELIGSAMEGYGQSMHGVDPHVAGPAFGIAAIGLVVWQAVRKIRDRGKQ